MYMTCGWLDRCLRRAYWLRQLRFSFAGLGSSLQHVVIAWRMRRLFVSTACQVANCGLGQCFREVRRFLSVRLVAAAYRHDFGSWR